jgi:hypothetical protein
MHGNILNQRFNFFLINAYKNYSKLEEKPQTESEKLHGSYEDDLFGLGFEISKDSINGLTALTRRNQYRRLDLRPKASVKKNTNYFYSTSDEPEFVTLNPYFNDGKVFVTVNENQLKRHYGKEFSEVQATIFERSITLTNEYLSIRINKYTKSRGLNCKYFSKNNISYGIKLNLKTGNFITYSNNGSRRRKTSIIRQNSFKHLLEIISSVFDFQIRFNDHRNGKVVEELFKEQINDEVFKKTLYHTICSLLDTEDFFNSHPQQQDIKNFTYESIIKLFVKIKGIKVPNNYTGYLINWYPTQKYLKKNENKLVLAILDRLNLKSKSLNTLLHKLPETNITNLITLAKLFGYTDVHKYIHNLDKRFLSVGSSRSIHSLGMTGYDILNNYFEYKLSSDEKSRLLKLLNNFFYKLDTEPSDVDLPNLISQQFIQITDHVSMIAKIRDYIPDIELRAQNFKDFHHEHIEYSKIERSIQKGYTIQYTFDDKLVKHIEEEMKFLLDTNEITSFYPVILKTDGEYSEEGKHMHHCVATYSDREQSIIISIREGDASGSERVTCEFDVKKNLIQAKSFCNAKPPERFQLAIDKLCHRVNIYRGSIKSLGKEKIPLVINGIQVPLKEEKINTLDFLFEAVNRDDLNVLAQEF